MLILDMGPSGVVGSFALCILMIPVVVRSTEEMLKLVPNELREASLALGVPKWRTILKVVLPTAIGGITTGVMLAIARIAGETAPIMLLVFGTQLHQRQPLRQAPQSSLPFYICEQYSAGSDAAVRPCLGGGPRAHRLRHDPQPRGSRHRPLEGPEDRSLTRPAHEQSATRTERSSDTHGQAHRCQKEERDPDGHDQSKGVHERLRTP
ncbi:hypothetical protein STENM36S_07341 [Streptomyces tendae]